MPSKTNPARDSRDSRRRQQAEMVRPELVSPPPDPDPYRDDLEEAQRENDDSHVSDK